ncbi:MAG: hypothetical protein SGPRY_011810 [Prymnesium sp.]
MGFCKRSGSSESRCTTQTQLSESSSCTSRELSSCEPSMSNSHEPSSSTSRELSSCTAHELSLSTTREPSMVDEELPLTVEMLQQLNIEDSHCSPGRRAPGPLQFLRSMRDRAPLRSLPALNPQAIGSAM